MTLQTFTMDGTPGAAVGGTNGAPVGTGAQCIYSDTDKVIGSTAVICTATAGQVAAVNSTFTIPNKVGGVDVFLRTLDRLPASGVATIGTARHANTSGTVFQIEWTATGGISFYENAGGLRNAVPGVTITTTNTWLRVQILFNINGSGGTAPNDSNATIKVFSATSPFTTQLGTTLTRTNVNLGTNPVSGFWGGALTAATPGYVGGEDNLRWDDTRTTDFTAPPVASDPTAVLGVSNQDPEEDATITFNYTGSTAGTGTINLWELTCTEAPQGSPLPAITGPATATPTSVPTTGGQYKYSGRVRNSSGLWSAPVEIIIYAHAKNAVDVKVRRVIDSGGWVVAGAAGPTSLLDALRNPSPTGAYWVESPADPAITQLLIVEMDPFGPDAISVFGTMYYADGPQDGHIGVYMPNATTLLEQGDYDLTAAPVQYETKLQPADLTTATTVARRNLVVKVAGGPA